MEYSTLKANVETLMAETQTRLATCNDTYRLDTILDMLSTGANRLWLEADMMVYELEMQMDREGWNDE